MQPLHATLACNPCNWAGLMGWAPCMQAVHATKHAPCMQQSSSCMHAGSQVLHAHRCCIHTAHVCVIMNYVWRHAAFGGDACVQHAKRFLTCCARWAAVLAHACPSSWSLFQQGKRHHHIHRFSGCVRSRGEMWRGALSPYVRNMPLVPSFVSLQRAFRYAFDAFQSCCFFVRGAAAAFASVPCASICTRQADRRAFASPPSQPAQSGHCHSKRQSVFGGVQLFCLSSPSLHPRKQTAVTPGYWLSPAFPP